MKSFRNTTTIILDHIDDGPGCQFILDVFHELIHLEMIPISVLAVSTTLSSILTMSNPPYSTPPSTSNLSTQSSYIPTVTTTSTTPTKVLSSTNSNAQTLTNVFQYPNTNWLFDSRKPVDIPVLSNPTRIQAIAFLSKIYGSRGVNIPHEDLNIIATMAEDSYRNMIALSYLPVGMVRRFYDPSLYDNSETNPSVRPSANISPAANEILKRQMKSASMVQLQSAVVKALPNDVKLCALCMTPLWPSSPSVSKGIPFHPNLAWYLCQGPFDRDVMRFEHAWNSLLGKLCWQIKSDDTDVSGDDVSVAFGRHHSASHRT
jgi:hypothetical protein